MSNPVPKSEVRLPLLKACSALREKISQVKSQEGSAQTVRTWRPIQEALPSHLERTQKLVAVMRRFHNRRMLPVGRSQAPLNLKPLFTNLTNLSDKFLNKPGKVMEGNTWANCKTNLAGAENALEENLKAIWIGYIGQLIPNVDELTPFLNLGRCAAEIRKITNLQNELKSLQQSLPDDDEVFRQAEEKSRDIKARVKKLDFGDIPPAIKKFIDRVNSVAGATLFDLTDEVFSWLREKNLLQSFRVK